MRRERRVKEKEKNDRGQMWKGRNRKKVAKKEGMRKYETEKG
jgi:hypothetical protein